MTWKNRIIGEGEEAPAQLLANPKNARRHPQAQQSALADVLDQVGVVQRVIVNQRTGYVVDGHARIALALRQGQPTIPVLYVDLDEREEALILAALDPISAMATYDTAALDELLREVDTGSAALQGLLTDLATDVGLYGLGQDDAQTDVDAEPQISRADELRAKWGTEAGQLWKLGEHRLAVGDCTDAAVVARVMGGEKALLCATDPPYGVSFEGAKYNPRAKEWGGIANDERKGSDLRAWLAAAIVVWREHMDPSAAYYFWSAAMEEGFAALLAIRDAGLHVQGQIVWAKNAFALGQADYQWKHESCWYAFQKGAQHRWFGGRAQTTVWDINRLVTSAYEHPMQKPTEIYGRAMENHTRPGEVCFDPFVGSGTSIVAAEQLGRRCRAIEIDPGYAAVTLQRWADATGGTPELID